MRQSKNAVLAIVATIVMSIGPAIGQADSPRQPVSLSTVSTTTPLSVPAHPKVPKTKAHRHHPRAHKHPQRPSWKVKALRFYTLNSTAYCNTGQTSTPKVSAHDGIVAVMGSWPLGRWYQVRSGALKGKILHGEDHIGSGSEFDVWMEDCSRANWYGRGQNPEKAPILVAEIASQVAEEALKHHH